MDITYQARWQIWHLCCILSQSSRQPVKACPILILDGLLLGYSTLSMVGVPLSVLQVNEMLQ